MSSRVRLRVGDEGVHSYSDHAVHVNSFGAGRYVSDG